MQGILWCFCYSDQKGQHPPKKISPQIYFQSNIFGEGGENKSTPLSSPMAPSCGWWIDVLSDDQILDSSGSMLVSHSCHTAATPQLLLWYFVALLFENLFCGWLLRLGKKFPARSGKIYPRFWWKWKESCLPPPHPTPICMPKRNCCLHLLWKLRGQLQGCYSKSVVN